MVKRGRSKKVRHYRADRLPRRTPEQLEKFLDRLVVVIRKAGSRGMTCEEIRTRLGVEYRELPKPLRLGTDSGRLQWSGNKRATRYYVV